MTTIHWHPPWHFKVVLWYTLVTSWWQAMTPDPPNRSILMTVWITHLSPFLSVMRLCLLAFMSRLRFPTMLSMQLSSAKQRVWDWMLCRQMGHSSFFLRHCLMQWQQKLWAQFRMTACGGHKGLRNYHMVYLTYSVSTIFWTSIKGFTKVINITWLIYIQEVFMCLGYIRTNITNESTEV